MYGRSQSNKHLGFTLIEIMIVVVILGVLAALVVPNMMGKAGDARQVAAASDLRAIANALDMYRLENFTYPSTDQGFKGFGRKTKWVSSGTPLESKWVLAQTPQRSLG